MFLSIATNDLNILVPVFITCFVRFKADLAIPKHPRLSVSTILFPVPACDQKTHAVCV